MSAPHVAHGSSDIIGIGPCLRGLPPIRSRRGGKDTLYRIHGTNQPGWIGHAISSGCRLTNEDVIDLYLALPPPGSSPNV